MASDLPEVDYVRRRYRERATPIALPGALVIAVACVAKIAGCTLGASSGLSATRLSVAQCQHCN